MSLKVWDRLNLIVVATNIVIAVPELFAGQFLGALLNLAIALFLYLVTNY